jgi:hypothetical protein
MGLLKVELGSYSETCHGGSQFVSIKVEEVTDIQSEEEEKKEEDPLLITYPELEAEVEVSESDYSNTCKCLSFLSVYVCFVHQHETSLLWWTDFKKPFQNDGEDVILFQIVEYYQQIPFP